MCRADVGFITYEWQASQLDPVGNFTAHQCVNWEKLDLWASERAVDVYKPGWLVHPTLGKSLRTNSCLLLRFSMLLVFDFILGPVYS